MKCECGTKLRLLGTAAKCWKCGKIVSQSRGLGDTIRKITTALHIPHCCGCDGRQQKLNEMFPYKG